MLMERQGLSPIFVSSGEEALKVVKIHNPGIIISDWYMPGMSGLELCKAVRQLDECSNAYFILVTGEDRQQHLAKGLEEGADDFLTKPYQADEIRARVLAGRRTLATRKNLEHSKIRLQEQVKELDSLNARQIAAIKTQQSLTSAAKIQQRLLPPKNSVLEGFRVGHVAKTALELAGDIFGCIPVGQDGDIGFFHVDVVGHGIAAALTSFSVARLLCSASAAREILTTDGRLSPAHKVVEKLNEHFSHDDDCDQYFTMIYGTLNSRTGKGQICQAGHPHPLIISPDGKSKTLGKGGLPVGLMEFSRYESVNFTLEPGERLFMYSDGAIEAQSPLGDQLGFLTLSGKAVTERKLPLQAWLENLESFVMNWTGTGDLEDDLSMMAIERIETQASQRVEIQ